jgi:hypothetical protein
MTGCPSWQDAPPPREKCIACDWYAAFCAGCEERETCTIYDKPKISPLSRELIRLHNICKEYGQMPNGRGVREERRYLVLMLGRVINTVQVEEQQRSRRQLRGENG